MKHSVLSWLVDVSFNEIRLYGYTNMQFKRYIQTRITFKRNLIGGSTVPEKNIYWPSLKNTMQF